MKVYVTGDGLRVRRRTYEKTVGLSRREAAHFKRRRSIDVDRATAAILVQEGWATESKPPDRGELIRSKETETNG